MNMRYMPIAWFEMTPDIYSGKNMDEHKPMWDGYCEGDKGSEVLEEPITLKAEHFPPGTKVIVKIPICPKCDETYENCVSSEYCDFDWHEWTENQYS